MAGVRKFVSYEVDSIMYEDAPRLNKRAVTPQKAVGGMVPLICLSLAAHRKRRKGREYQDFFKPLPTEYTVRRYR